MEKQARITPTIIDFRSPKDDKSLQDIKFAASAPKGKCSILEKEVCSGFKQISTGLPPFKDNNQQQFINMVYIYLLNNFHTFVE